MISGPGARSYPIGWTLAAAFLLHVAINGMRPMSSYRALSIGATVEQLALLPISFAVIALFAAIPLGRAADRHGGGRLVAGACGLVALAAFLIGMAESLVLLIAAQSLAGLGLVAAAVGLQTVIANAGPMAGSEGRFGTFTAVVSLGQLLGPASAGILAETALAAGLAPPADTYGTRLTLLALAVCAFVAMFVATRLPDSRLPDAIPTARSRPPTLDAAQGILRVPGMWRALVASVAVFVAIDLLSIYLPAYGTERGWSVGFVAALLAFRAAASLATRLFVSSLVRALGRRNLMLGGLLTGALGITLVPLDGLDNGPGAPAGITAIVFISVFGMAVGVGQPLTMSWVARSAPKPFRSMSLGVRLTANQIGQLGVPAVVGLAIGALGPVWLFWSIGAMLSVVAGLLAGATLDDAPLEEEIPPP